MNRKSKAKYTPKKDKFKWAADEILGKLKSLKECKKTIREAASSLKFASNNLMEKYARLEGEIDSKSKTGSVVRVTGMAVSAFGAIMTLGLWVFDADTEGLTATLAWAATIAGVGGFLLKTGATYYQSRSESFYQEEISKDFTKLEDELKINLAKMIEIFKFFQKIVISDSKSSPDLNDNLIKTSKEKDTDTDIDPTAIVALDGIDNSATAAGGLDSAIGFIGEYDIGALAGVESTFDSVKTAVAEVVSLGALEGLANSVGCITSFYEIYKFSQSSTTSDNIKKTIEKLESKVTCYSSIEKYFQAVDRFKQFNIVQRKN